MRNKLILLYLKTVSKLFELGLALDFPFDPTKVCQEGSGSGGDDLDWDGDYPEGTVNKQTPPLHQPTVIVLVPPVQQAVHQGGQDGGQKQEE